MAIHIDSTELSSTSRMPRVRGAIASDCLEAVSGADIMVSPLGMPASTETLIRKHAEGGAIFIQRKSMCDMISSILDERINVALARMIGCGTTHQYQRCIMSTGVIVPDVVDGAVMIGQPKETTKGHTFIEYRKCEPPIQYVSFATIRRRIAMRGGWYLPLICDAEIPGELFHLQQDLEYLSRHPEKELLIQKDFPPDPPEPDDPLQTPVEVRDGRLVMAAFQGVGIGKAGALWDTIKGYNRIHRPAEDGFTEENWKPTVLQMLVWASRSTHNIFDLPKVPMWGAGTHKSIREQLGLYPGQDITVTPGMIPDANGGEENEEESD